MLVWASRSRQTLSLSRRVVSRRAFLPTSNRSKCLLNRLANEVNGHLMGILNKRGICDRNHDRMTAQATALTAILAKETHSQRAARLGRFQGSDEVLALPGCRKDDQGVVCRQQCLALPCEDLL